MKFQTTPYHYDLLRDYERIAAFKQAITQYESFCTRAFDLGCGSGILSYFLADKFENVEAFEINRKAYCCALNNLKSFDNVDVVNCDVLEYDFKQKADLIVCEMLDTALIDEEEVPVLNYVKKFLKDDGEIIPSGIFNYASLVNMNRRNICWEEDVRCEEFSNEILYDVINFKDDINPDFESNLEFKIKKDGIINALKITSVTKLNENIVCGPTPMLNPPLLIPINEKQVMENNIIHVNLKYIMGNGIGSIKTKII